jgi:outer membrane protein assembly factor BamB
VKWSHDSRADGREAQFHADPLITASLLITGSDAEPTADLYAFDLRSGRVVWKTPAAGGVGFGLLNNGSRGFALDMRGQVFSFELATGRRLWTFDEAREEGSRPPGAPALEGDRLFFASRSGTVYALDSGSGHVVWKRTLGETLNTSVLIVKDHILIGTAGGRLHRLDAATGAVTATLETGGPAFGTLVAAGGCVVSLSAPATVACVEPELGRVRWKQTTPEEISSFRPLVVDKVVVVGGTGGAVIAYRLEDGREIWRRNVRGAARGLGASAGVLYVGTLRGTVSAIQLPEEPAKPKPAPPAPHQAP